MRTASLGLRDAIREGKQPHIQVFVTWGDGTTEWLHEEDFMTDSISFQNGTTGNGSFDVGGAVISSFNFHLNNWNEKFDNKVFAGAKITAYVGLAVATFDFAFITEAGEEFVTEDEEDVLVTENAREDYGEIEWLEYGTYYFVNHRSVGKTILCETYDALKLLDENNLSDNVIPYPITARQLVRIITTHNAIVQKNYNFMNGDIIIQEAPESDITERQALSYIAQMCGCFAVINSQGLLELKWYGEPDSIVRSRFDHNLDVEDIRITGVNVYYGTEEGKNYLQGEEGYVIGVRNNPFVNENNYRTVAMNIARNVVGLTFRSGSMNALSDITVEAGDVLRTYDDRGTLCAFIVTNLEYRMSLRETFTCDAVPIEKNDLRQLESNVFIERVRNSIRSEITAYDAQYMQLSRLMSMSMGMFETKEVSADGSYVLYLHNKPKLAESSTVWKMTADAFAVSTNYNAGEGLRIWRAGITSNGDAVVNILSAIGINAGWVETGLLTDKTNTNYWNLDTGELQLSAGTRVGDSGYSLAQIQVNAEGLSTKVSAGNIASTINQTAQSVLIRADKINLSGYITATNLRKKGQTVINGENITTGIIHDTGNNVEFNLTKGTLKILKGEIRIGQMARGSKTAAGRGFSVTDQGVVTLGDIEMFVTASDKSRISTDTAANSGRVIFYRGIYAGGGEGADGKGLKAPSVIEGLTVRVGSGNIKTSDDGDTAEQRRGFICKAPAYFKSHIDLYRAGSGDEYYDVDSRGQIKIRNVTENGYALLCEGQARFNRNIYGQIWPLPDSDRRLKKNIEDISVAKSEELIYSLRPVKFVFKKGDERVHHGFIAQEVEEIAPRLVYKSKHDGGEYLSLNYMDIIADLVNVAQTQHKEIEDLQSRIARLEKKV